MRQVAARVNTGAKRVGGFISGPTGSKLIMGTFQTGIRLVQFAGRHAGRAGNCPVKSQCDALGVPQVSKPAVAPISKSAERRLTKRVGPAHGSQVWKPARQQTGKSAVRPRGWPGSGVQCLNFSGNIHPPKFPPVSAPKRGPLLLDHQRAVPVSGAPGVATVRGWAVPIVMESNCGEPAAKLTSSPVTFGGGVPGFGGGSLAQPASASRQVRSKA